MPTFEVIVTYKWTARYTMQAEKESDIDQMVHDDLQWNIIWIEDVTDRSDYSVEAFEKETEAVEEDDVPVIYDCQDWR